MRSFRFLIAAALVSVAVPTAVVVAQDAAPDPATRPPADILADVARDLATVKSYHATETSVDDTGRSSYVADVDARRGYRLRMSQGHAAVTVLRIGKSTFMKGSAAYWRSAGVRRTVAAKLADRWVRSPAAAEKSFDEVASGLSPGEIAGCLVRDHGTLTNGGVRSLGPQPAVVVVDQGDQPGTTPGEIWVSTTGRALPLRVRQTGRRRAGPIDKDCEEAGDTTTSDDARFSRYDERVDLRAPARWLELRGDSKSGGGSSR